MLKSLAALLALGALASAHYTFPILTVEGVDTPAWQYVRKTNNYPDDDLWPLWGDINDPNLRCYDSARTEKPQTYNVTAGTKLGFKVKSIDGLQQTYHESITNVYLARAPANIDVADWNADGEVWFKIHEWTASVIDEHTMQFESLNRTHFEFDLPTSLPSGQYLVRIENIAIHATYITDRPLQWFLACAQINVADGGNGVPGPKVAIPGHVTGQEPGLDIDITNPPAVYVQPGPAVWVG